MKTLLKIVIQLKSFILIFCFKTKNKESEESFPTITITTEKSITVEEPVQKLCTGIHKKNLAWEFISKLFLFCCIYFYSENDITKSYIAFYYTISQYKDLFHPKIKCSVIRIISNFNKHESEEINF